ncbi:MAG TPA: FecR domain-containing protein [Puia sp.]|nr:FecR domain-containing protein [Puia sp.]
MTAGQFFELIGRYKEGRLSEADWSALREALAEGTYDEVLEEDIRTVFDSHGAHESWSTLREQELWKKVEARRNLEDPGGSADAKDPAIPGVSGGPARVVPFYRRRRFVWTAAAAVLILAGGVAFLFTPKEKPASSATMAATAIPPGSSKAILTLAGGQQVVLGKDTRGAVASQGGIQVMQSDSGQLTYVRGRDEKSEVLYNSVTTPRGGQYQVVLADGTKVWLNAASSLRYPTIFSGKEREVELTGEAYFEVKHNTARPFRVKTGGQVIEDIGTAFNIHAYDDEPVAKTTLLEGAVKVTGKTTLVLKPGQQAQQHKGGALSLTEGVDVEEVIAWKNGQISFANADFTSLMREVSRWYDVDIHYSGAVPSLHVFGLLDRRVYLSSILEFLQKNGVRIKQEGRVLTILP